MLQSRSFFPKRSDAIAVRRPGFYTRLHRADQGLCKHTPAFDDGAVDTLRNKSFFIEFILEKIMPINLTNLTSTLSSCASANAADESQPGAHPVRLDNLPPQRTTASLPAHIRTTGQRDQLVRQLRTEQAATLAPTEAEPRVSTSSLRSAGPSTGNKNDLQTLAADGLKLRAKLAKCKTPEDFKQYGEMGEFHGVPALKFSDTKEGIQNFRSLLAASKVAIGINGAAVLIRQEAGYTGAKMYALKEDNFKTVGGLTPEGTMISICKGDGSVTNADGSKAPDARLDHMLKLICDESLENGKTPHFACIASIAEIYHRKAGAELIGVVAKKVEDHTPGWGAEHTENAKKTGQWDKNVFKTTIDGEPVEFNMPLVGMRVNAELYAKVQDQGKPLDKPAQPFIDFGQLKVFGNALDIYDSAQAMDNEQKQKAEPMPAAA